MTTSYTIGELARASGVTTATLRYYDELDLLKPTSRTPSGYRTYRADDVGRLEFVGRAKRLGCTLGEITGLLQAYDGGECGPLQEQLSALVADKVERAQRQLLEVTMLLADLQRAAAGLSRHRAVGACDELCGCVTQPVAIGADCSSGGGERIVERSVEMPSSTAVAVRIGGGRGSESQPIACTLPPAEMPQRLSNFQTLFAHASRRVAIDRGVRLELSDVDPVEVVALLQAEQRCCAFWEFALTIDVRGVAVEVRGPDGTEDLIAGLFGVGTEPVASAR